MNFARSMKKRAGAMFAALLCLSMAGCSFGPQKNSSQDDDVESAYAPVVPENRIDENVPGENIDAKVGDNIDYKAKVTATLDEVVELDDVDKMKSRVLVAVMTITNNSDAALDCSSLTHFSVKIDDSEQTAPLHDVQAAVLVRKYCVRTDNGLKTFNQAIEPGQSLKGYVYLGMPSSWKTLQLVYTPYKYYSNDTITFDIEETQLTHYDGDLD